MHPDGQLNVTENRTLERNWNDRIQQVPEFWELGQGPLTEIEGVQWRAAL